MATGASILAWRIPWIEEPGRLSPQGCTESDMTKANEQGGGIGLGTHVNPWLFHSNV